MKHVNNALVNTKIMTPAEIAEFRRAVQAIFPPDSDQYFRATDVRARYTWVKMPMVEDLSDADFLPPGKGIDTAVVKQNIKKLSDDAAWLDLGNVVAVDIFNGNSDRFDIEDGEWVNKGNIMFLTGGQTKVIGLDTFDPQAQRSNLVAHGGYDELRILVEEKRRLEFARACVRSVAMKTKKELEKGGVALIAFLSDSNPPERVRILVATMDTLFDPYAEVFARGIKEGADTLKQYLQAKIRQYRIPRPAPLPPPPLMQNRPRLIPSGALPPPPPRAQNPPRPIPPGVLPPPPPPPNPNLVRFAQPDAVPPPPAAAGLGPNPRLPVQPAAPPPAGRTVPQGILDRMFRLGWNV